MLLDMTFSRITVDASVMGGMPCIRGMRVPVATVVAMVADGMTIEEILTDLPYLEAEEKVTTPSIPPLSALTSHPMPRRWSQAHTATWRVRVRNLPIL